MTDMTTTEVKVLYESLENSYLTHEDISYASLVTPNGNGHRPLHRWFHLKEGFSCDLLSQILRDCGLHHRRGLTLLDPYAGVGTSVIAAMEQDTEWQSYGVERNPFLHFVANSKVMALQGEADGDFHQFVGRVLKASRDIAAGSAPVLSTFSRRDYFSEADLELLLKLRSAIEAVPGSTCSRDLARLCLAASLESVSSLRRDGRALRLVPDKVRSRPIAEFLRRCAVVAEDLWLRDRPTGVGQVQLGDGRELGYLPAGFLADLVLFSPPYPNNIDYTEVYKLEAWFLRFIENNEEFRRQRLLTVRSHPSIKFPDELFAHSNGYRGRFDATLLPLLESIPANEDRAWRRSLVQGYFDDMLRTLVSARSHLKDDGWLVYVVGNSLHGSGNDKFLIAADLIIARLAELVGYRVVEVRIARRPKRRAEALPFLRESVVFLRKA